MINPFSDVWVFSSWIFGILLVLLFILCVVDRTKRGEGLINIQKYITEATIALVLGTLLMGSWQMGVINKEDKAKILLDLKQSFYYSNPTNRKIIEAIDNGWLKVTSESFASGYARPKGLFTDFEVDEYIINFDYMNIFINKSMLDEKDVNQVFGWYIRKAWKDPAIQGYIKRIRAQEKSVYSNFESLANKVKKEE